RARRARGSGAVRRRGSGLPRRDARGRPRGRHATAPRTLPLLRARRGRAPGGRRVSPRVLVAGVGNVFLGDDGFGVEVARRLVGETFPDGVQVADFGIRGVHLAYELLEGYDLLILVDAAPRGEEAGTVFVLEPDFEHADRLERGESGVAADARGTGPA